MNDPDDLGIVDTSWLTDADWAVINRLRRIHETEGQKAVREALRALEPQSYLRVAAAVLPDKVRDAIKDEMAENQKTSHRSQYEGRDSTPLASVPAVNCAGECQLFAVKGQFLNAKKYQLALIRRVFLTAFQAYDEGSIPFTRSKPSKHLAATSRSLAVRMISFR